MKLLAVIFCSLLLIANCQKNLIDKVAQEDYKIVRPGKYPGNTLPGRGNFDLSEQLISNFDEDEDFLDLIVQRIFPRVGDLDYYYTTTRRDEENKRLVIRYFGGLKQKSTIAGYQIQFVFDSGRRLIQVCVSEVPLE